MERCPRNHTLPVPDLGLAGGRTWSATKDHRLWSAHLEHGQVAIAAGTRLRAEQSVAGADSQAHMVIYRLFVLDGANAGDCVWLETDKRAGLTRHGLKNAGTMDEYWDMGPGQSGSDAFRCERGGSTVAHLYAYAGSDDPEYPRCGTEIRLAETRPAVFGDEQCLGCLRWYEQNIWMPMVS